MGRKASIGKILAEWTQQILKEKELAGKIGVKAEDVADILKIHRSNVSHYLNCLVKEEKAIKIIGRPVYFLDRISVEKKMNRMLRPDELIVEDLNIINYCDKEGRKEISKIKNPSLQSIFNSLMGYNISLAQQIEQAKAAILYPPNGLHTLIIGPTGVGKSLFAQKMYEFAKEIKAIKPEMNFIVFNCADYSSNPQLLFSQLFGHVKGAFTGADADRTGLVEIADGSILFLDEIHRLPPEGQETLFNLMDHGTFRRLGETKQVRKAQVRIIGATTINPDTVLLQTFLRRIPLTIYIPALSERPFIERMTFIERLFCEESKKFEMPIRVEPQIIYALLLYDCPWNIGQLKSDIQMICALAYVEFSISEEKEITISSRHAKIQLKNYTNMFIEYHDLFRKVIYEEEKWCRFDNRNIRNYDLKFYSYEKENEFLYDQEQAMDFINQSIYSNKQDNDIENLMSYYSFLRSIVKNKERAHKVFSEVISEGIFKLTDYALKKIGEVNDIPIDKQLSFIVLSIHLHFVIKRVGLGINLKNLGLENVKENIPRHYSVAKTIANILYEKVNKDISEEEISYMAFIIKTVQGWKGEEVSKVGIVVNCKDDRTKQMIKVAQSLLDTDHGVGLELPNNEKSTEYKQMIQEAIMKADEGKGVLFLCENPIVKDYLNDVVRKKGIKVKMIYRVSTAIVVEAIRLALQPVEDLDSIAKSLGKMIPGGSSLEFSGYKNKVITDHGCTESHILLTELQKKVKKLLG